VCGLLFRTCGLLCALLIITQSASADEVSSLNGKSVTGVLSSINASDIIIKTDAGPVTLPLSQVLLVKMRDTRPIDPAVKFTNVVLTDDTVLHCKSVAFQGKEVEMTLPSGAVLKVPLTSVASFVREAHNQPLVRKFEELVGRKSNRDRIVILKDGQLNTLEGTLGDVKGQTIAFKPENSPVADIQLERLHGIIFFRAAPVGAARAICKVNDIEGNTLTAVKLAYDGTSLKVTTTAGNELMLPQEVLANLDFNLGKLTFLSDLVPIKVVEKSGIGLVHSIKRDTNLDGDPILLDKSYAKGLSMHAYTDVEYNLGAKFKEFRGVLGVDPRTGDKSQPKVTIYCDDVVVFSDVLTAKKIQPLNLNVKGVRTLRIVVASKNILDLYDHVTLAEGQVSQ
jgi:hypothetical protein